MTTPVSITPDDHDEDTSRVPTPIAVNSARFSEASTISGHHPFIDNTIALEEHDVVSPLAPVLDNPFDDHLHPAEVEAANANLLLPHSAPSPSRSLSISSAAELHILHDFDDIPDLPPDLGTPDISRARTYLLVNNSSG